MKINKKKALRVPGYKRLRVERSGVVWLFHPRKRVWGVLKPHPHIYSRHSIVRVRDAANRIKYRGVHQLVLLTFVGPCPPGMECRHLDDNPSNNNLENLCWGTRKQNMKDRVLNGIAIRGSQRVESKLTESQVLEARRRYKSGGVYLRVLAAEFGVHPVTLGDAVRGKTWAWL